MQKLRGVFSNSVEFGADRVVFLAPNISAEDAAYADAILMACPTANLEALLRQHQMVVEQAAEDEATKSIHYAAGGLGSHPNLFTRMRMNKELENLDAFKPWRDPFIGAVELWLDLSQAITEREVVVNGADRPAVHLANTQVSLDKLKELAKDLTDLLVEAVLEDLAGGDQVRIERFMVMRKILEKQIEKTRFSLDRSSREKDSTGFLFADKWLTQLAKEGRVISELIRAINSDSRVKTKVDSELQKALVKQLTELRPSDETRRRDEELLKLAEACKGKPAGGKKPGKSGA